MLSKEIDQDVGTLHTETEIGSSISSVIITFSCLSYIDSCRSIIAFIIIIMHYCISYFLIFKYGLEIKIINLKIYGLLGFL